MGGVQPVLSRHVGLEPLVLTAAFGLGDDPGAEVQGACPEAAAGELDVERWVAAWRATWRRRFGEVSG
jgi:hypothetical protein